MRAFPQALVREDGGFTLFDRIQPFACPDGIQHPASAWELWTDEDWADRCPGWRLAPVIDEPPLVEETKAVARKPEAEWELTDTGLRVTYTVVDRSDDDILLLLAGAREQAVARVNLEAGAARTRYITAIPGQEGTYVEKAREARAYAEDPAPTPARYPYLAAEAAHTGSTLDAVAVLVRMTADAWTSVNAEIEGLRQGALARIKAAATAADMAAVFPIVWPTPP